MVQKQLVKVYKNGLSDKRIRNKLYRAHPQTIEQALELAMEENKILRHIDQNDQPEPMEVDAVKTATDPLEKKVEKLTELVNVLLVQHKVKLNKETCNHNRPSSISRNPPLSTPAVPRRTTETTGTQATPRAETP